MIDALKLRGDMAAGVAAGTETPADAVTRLKAQASPTGLKIDADADFAFAAVDIGRRLIVLGKLASAAQFFREAEISLTVMIAKISDTLAEEKAQYLVTRADIRAHFLNKPAAARADIDEAIRLQPDSKYLQQVRVNLASGRAEYFKDATKG